MEVGSRVPLRDRGSPKPGALSGTALAVQMVDRCAHLVGVPRRPVVVLRQPGDAGATACDDDLRRETLRTVLLAQGHLCRYLLAARLPQSGAATHASAPRQARQYHCRRRGLGGAGNRMRGYGLRGDSDMSVLVDDGRLSAVYVTNDRSHGVRASCRACDTGGLVSNSTAFSTQPAFQLVRDGLNRGLLAQGAFPDGRDSPARLQQAVAVPSVPFDVRIELGLPEFPARARCRRVRAAGVPVPEAAVHEAYGTESTKHEVRCPRKSAVVQTESKTAGMDGSTQGEFGPSVPASDPRHHARTSRTIHDVCHRRCRAVLGGDRPATGYTRG